MTLLDRRPALPALEPPRAGSALWQPFALGAGAALVSLLVLLLPVLAVWAGDAHSPGTWQQAAGLAAATWLASLGGHVTFDGVMISFMPLVLAAIPVGLLAWSGTWLLRRRADDDVMVGQCLPRTVLRSLALWWVGYAVIVASAAGLSFVGPARPSWEWLPVILLVTPGLALALATARVARDEEWLLGARLDGSMLPDWLRRAVGPAVRGVVALMLLGSLVLGAAVGLHWDEVRSVQSAVGGGAGSAAALSAVQLAALPNLSIWVMSFLAGPGFSVVQGASLSWSGASTGLLPLVPVLAAHPQPGTFPWFMPVVALLPSLIGAYVGRRALATVARLAALRTKLKVAVAAALMCAALVGIIDVMGGSSLGAYRLADIGAPAGWLTLTLGGELLAGAVLVVLHDAWRLRR